MGLWMENQVLKHIKDNLAIMCKTLMHHPCNLEGQNGYNKMEIWQVLWMENQAQKPSKDNLAPICKNLMHHPCNLNMTHPQMRLMMILKLSTNQASIDHIPKYWHRLPHKI